MSGLLSNIVGIVWPLDKEEIAEIRVRQDMLTEPQGNLVGHVPLTFTLLPS